jgi:putative membrane protein
VLTAVTAFLTYFLSATGLLALFVLIYVRITPYNDFDLIAHDNSAAAVALAGAVIGFTLPLVACVYYTQSLLEMVVWSAITCLIQVLVFAALRRQAHMIAEGHVSSAIMVATFSVAVGLLSAVSISH